MKIALVSTIEETIPPTKYGGVEWIVYHLAHQLSLRGHTVDLYAAGDSKQESQYNLIPIVEKSLRSVAEYKDNSPLRDMVKLVTMYETALALKDKNYDIIHNHASWKFLIFSHLINCPLLTTHHNLFNYVNGRTVYQNNKNLPFVSISNNQRKELPELNFVSTVYNGIDISTFPFVEEVSKDAPMIFLARMTDGKGAIEAAETAHRLKKQIQFGAKVDVYDQPYFEKFRPLIDNTYVQFLGELGLEKINYLKASRCMLLPIKWEEPFGLMFTEAMACGTPVVSFSRGSAPEIIIDGETGFLVNQSDEYNRGDFIIKKTGIEGLCEAVDRIYNMPESEYKEMRRKSRARVESMFTVEKMIDGYEAVYKKILSNT